MQGILHYGRFELVGYTGGQVNYVSLVDGHDAVQLERAGIARAEQRSAGTQFSWMSHSSREM